MSICLIQMRIAGNEEGLLKRLHIRSLPEDVIDLLVFGGEKARELLALCSNLIVVRLVEIFDGVFISLHQPHNAFFDIS